MKYNFRKLNDLNDRVLLCPRCCEALFRTDIEHYTSCPYCTLPLEMNNELEDFLLEPIVDGWTATEQRRMM
jgi:uncharacterized CHY-type Zn-finger protein